MTEYQQEELLNASITDILLGEDKKTFEKNIKRMEKGCQFSYEYKELFFKTRNGSLKPIFIISHTIEYKNEYAGFCMVIDKTDEKVCEVLYKSLSEINQLIILTDDKESLLQSVCDTLIEKAGFSLAAIGTIDKKTKLFNIRFISSKEKRFSDIMKTLTISVDPSVKEGRGTVSMAYNTKKTAFITDVLNDERMAAWKQYQKDLFIHSVCSIPLLRKNKVEYILVVYSSVSDFFTSKHIDLLEELRMDLSFALEKIQSQEDIVLLSKAISKTHEWAVITDNKGTVIWANKAVSDISGYKKSELIGKKPNIFKSGYHNRHFYDKLWKTVTSGREYSCKFINRAKDGSLFYLDSIIIPITKNGRIHRLVDLSRDVTKETLFSKRLEFQSSIYKTLYRLTNISIDVKNKEEYLINLSKVFTEHTKIDISFILTPTGKGLELTTQHTNSEEFKHLASISKSLFEKLYFSKDNRAPVIKTLKYGKIYIQNDIVKESCYPFNKLAETYDMGSCCSLPIIQKGKTFAVLVMVSKQKNLFDKRLYELLSTVSRQIEFILNNIEENRFHNIVLKALDTGFEFVVITDKNFNIIYANKTVQRLSGYKEEELIGKHHSIFSSHKHSKRFARHFYKTVTSGKTYSGVITYRIKNGKLLDFISAVVPYKINDSIEYYIGVGKKLTRKEALLKQMDKMLREDRLTGLLNAKAFAESLENLLIEAKKEETVGAVAVINPLSFKNINEAFGFQKGDKLLNQIAKRLKDTVFDADIIAKLESDRFGLILKNLENEEASLIASSKILSKLIKPYKIEQDTVVLSFNIGLSLFPKDASTPKELIDKAQLALADAKSKGENQIGFFRKDFENRASKVLKLRAELEFAVKNREFLAYYQPYVDSDSRLAGTEALIRWEKDKKIVPPMDFIPYLEETNLIIDVEDDFMETVLGCIHKLKSQKIKPIPISVNLSAKSLNNKKLFENVLNKLNNYQIEPHYLRIEIIERLFIENFDYLKELMNKFKKQNISFAVDDFGTGYSSLSYLAKLPIDYLKIDISFVRALDLQQARSVVKSIIFLSKELGIKTVAEGVEDKEQFEILKNMGCDYFQGYLFYKPMPESQFKEILSTTKTC